MDDRDLTEIKMRLIGGQHHLGRLATMAAIYQAGKVIVAELDMPLTTGQKNGVKTAFNGLSSKIETAADKLPELTGKVGVVDQALLKTVQDVPARVFNLITELIQNIEPLLNNIQPDVQADNTFRFEFSDELAQQAANSLATARDAMKFWIGQERLKVT